MRLGLFSLLMLLASLPVLAQEAQWINVPEQPLADALRVLGNQTHVPIIFKGDQVEAYQSVPVTGSYKFADALKKMLGDSGVTFELRDGAAIVKPAADVARSRVKPPSPKPEENTRNASVPDRPSKPEEVLVSTTHLHGVTPATWPLKSLGVEDFRISGVDSVAELLRSRAINFPLIAPDTAWNCGSNIICATNRAAGDSVNLHGTGIGSTLVLINGQPMAPGGSGALFPDISMIPLSALERVDILPYGASALYGSDAVGGVVNLVLRKDYEGSETALRYSDTQRGGGRRTTISQIFGTDWGDTHATLVYEFGQEWALSADDRDFLYKQNGRFDVWPRRSRHSAVLTARRAFSDETVLSGSVLYSRRSFDQRSFNQVNPAIGFNTRSEGLVEYVHAALELRSQVADSWQWRLSAAQAMHLENGSNSSSDTAFIQLSVADFQTQARLTSVDAWIDGALWDLYGGPLRLSIGAGARREGFDDWSQFGSLGKGLRRNVQSASAELLIPLIGEQNGAQWANRVDLSMIGRVDHYLCDTYGGDNASSFNPGIGIVWSPVKGIDVRATGSKSFRAPPLSQVSEQSTSVLPTFLKPSDASGKQSVGLLITGGNDDLRPEQAQSMTVGIDLTPDWVAGLAVSVSYFNIDYTGKISTPLVRGSPTDALAHYEMLAPFITLVPTAAQVNYWYGHYGRKFASGTEQAGIDLIFDDRWQNIATTRVNGLEVAAGYGRDIRASRLAFEVTVEYLLELEQQIASTVLPVDAMNTVFNPPELRIQAHADWAWNQYAASLDFNFVGASEDSFASPPQDVSSWWTLNARVGAQIGGGALEEDSGWHASVSVENLFDRAPPLISAGASRLGYDPTHSSPFGRSLTVQIKKRW